METVSKMVPERIKQQIGIGCSNNFSLSSTSSSLLTFFVNQPLFHHIIEELTDTKDGVCKKNKESGLELKKKGNEAYLIGDYSKALSLYSKALRVAPVDAYDKDKNMLAVLYINRASALHVSTGVGKSKSTIFNNCGVIKKLKVSGFQNKEFRVHTSKMDLLAESIRDCDRALIISPTYAKAWYRRGKVNVSLANYGDATRDLHVAMYLELSSSGKKQIEEECESISVQQKITNSSMNKANERIVNNFQVLSLSDVSQRKKLQCVSTPTKGRGMTSEDNVPQASLVHSEEPYAAVILKSCRETHCHFCLNELPVDTVPCLSCSMPVYCSQQCQALAGSKTTGVDTMSRDILEKLPDEIKRHIADITSEKHTVSDIQNFSEHKHECGGVHWSAVLPTEIVLAGRILMKTVEQQRHCSPGSCITEIKDLCHNYEQLLPARKLELHISSIILLYCLQQSYSLDFPKNGDTVSKFVILLSQINVNSMAIVRMKCRDSYGQLDSQAGEALTSYVEQVKVGQAIYLVGSLFNHSCQPNIHAYFLSRALFMRTTEFVQAGCPLELSYGPQVGESDCKKRREMLEDRYYFRCGCRGCAETNLSDLVLNAYRCTKPNCFGVVPDYCETQYEKQKIQQEEDTIKYREISKVASRVLQRSTGSYLCEPGECLNCGFNCDLEVAHTTASKADVGVKGLQLEIVANAVQTKTLSKALISLNQMRLTLHAWNKRIAEVEDNLAHAFCLVGKLQLAVKHCKASLQILEKLYGPDHIAIGNELLKLSSVQLAMCDQSAVDSINHLLVIFSRYYGSHANAIFPCLQGLEMAAHKLAP